MLLAILMLLLSVRPFHTIDYDTYCREVFIEGDVVLMEIHVSSSASSLLNEDDDWHIIPITIEHDDRGFTIVGLTTESCRQRTYRSRLTPRTFGHLRLITLEDVNRGKL